MTFYKGTNIEQDGRFVNKDKKLMDKLNFPPEYTTSIYKSKLNLKIIQSWVEKKIRDILSFDDECLSNFIINLIEDGEEILQPKKIQYSITGFLDDKTYEFMQSFWKILISAQNAPDGIPMELIEEKKEEIIQNTKKQKEKLKFLEDLMKKDDKKNEKEVKGEKKDDRSRSRSRSIYSSGEKYRKRRGDRSYRHKHHRHRHRHKHNGWNRKGSSDDHSSSERRSRNSSKSS